MGNSKSGNGRGMEEGSMPKAVQTLMFQLLETELGGVQVYQKAIECAVNEDLKEEWEKYLEETKEHVEIATGLLEEMGLDPNDENGPGRKLVKMTAEALVARMETARGEGDPDGAQLTACEAVVEAETKDHQNWELLGQLAKSMKNDLGKKLLEAQEEVEEQEDEHLYHTKGWCRELWLEGLGLPTELPPPEEKKDVKTAIQAEKAKKASEQRRAKPARRMPSSKGGRSKMARSRR